MNTKPTAAQVAKLFGCSADQVRAHQLACAGDMDRIADRARATGRKVAGLTEQQARRYAALNREAAAR